MPLFDQCVLLADGREVYAGPTYTANPDGSLSTNGVMGWLDDVGYHCPMFESPPDFLLDLINTRVDEPEVDAVDGEGAKIDVAEGGGLAIRDRSAMVRELTEWWAKSNRRSAYLADGDTIAKMDAVRNNDEDVGKDNARRHWAVTWIARYNALFGRTFLYKLREPSAVMSQAVNSVALPLIIGSLYYNTPLTVSGAGDRLRAISLIVLMQSFSAFDQLLLFPKERGNYLHESNGGMYPTSAYYMARILVEMVTIVLFAIVCAVIAYEMFGLSDSGEARMEFYCIIVAVTVAGASFLTMVGTLCKTFEQTNAMAATMLIVLMLFDGNWINRRNIPVYYRWLPDVSFIGYAVEGAVASDFKRHSFTCTERAIAEEGCVPLTGDQYLRMLDFDPDSTWPMFWLLVLVSACYRIVAFFALHFMWTGQTYAERWAKLIHSSA
jgi:ABC-type multidrug transport system permease subunit